MWQPHLTRAMLVAAGDAGNLDILKSIDRATAHIIGIDGGADMLAALGMRPDAVLGDMDSVNNVFENPVPLPDQNQSDLEKSIVYLLAHGVKDFTIYGALGGTRIDHTIANLDLLCKYAGHARLAIVDRGTIIEGLSVQNTAPAGLELSVQPHTLLSVLAFGGPANITLRGTKYEMHAAKLDHGTHGVGNTALNDKVHIQIHEGCAWLMRIV